MPAARFRPLRCVVLGAVLAWSRSSSAADPAPPASAPDAAPIGGDNAANHIPPGSFVWRPWALFDPYLSPRSTVLTGGPVWERFSGEATEHSGYEGAYGKTVESDAGPLRVRLQQDYVDLRITSPGHWVTSLARYSYGGALELGPVELSGRAGITLAELHFGSGGFGLGFFCPRVSAGAALQVGPIRLGAIAFSEYAWRWFGGPSAFVRGWLVEIALGRSPAGLPPYYRINN